jgi:hypothetical protein
MNNLINLIKLFNKNQKSMTSSSENSLFDNNLIQASKIISIQQTYINELENNTKHMEMFYNAINELCEGESRFGIIITDIKRLCIKSSKLEINENGLEILNIEEDLYPDIELPRLYGKYYDVDCLHDFIYELQIGTFILQKVCCHDDYILVPSTEMSCMDIINTYNKLLKENRIWPHNSIGAHVKECICT